MYSLLVDAMYRLEVWKSFFENAGFIIMILGFILLITVPFVSIMSDDNCDGQKKTWVVGAIAGLSLLIASIFVCISGSPLLDVKWQMARTVAPKVDEYIRENPNSLLDATNIVKYGDRLVEDLGLTLIDYLKEEKQ